MNISGEELDDLEILVRVTSARRLAKNGIARRVRLDAGASLSEVARAVEVSKATIHKWETGQRSPTGVNGVRYFMILSALAPATRASQRRLNHAGPE